MRPRYPASVLTGDVLCVLSAAGIRLTPDPADLAPIDELCAQILTALGVNPDPPDPGQDEPGADQ